MPLNSNFKTPLTTETRWLLVYFLIATTGGALRKWVTSSGAVSNVILGIQMIIPFLMFYYRSANCYSPFRQYGILYIYFAYLAFHIIFPLQFTVYHGLFGMLVHGGFWLGVFYYFSNRHLFQADRLMNVFLIVAAVEIILAFVQYQLPSTHWLNQYAREGQSIALVGDRVRVTGTFSYLSGYTAYLIFFPLMVWAMVRLRYPQWLVVMTAAFGIAASFMTGSRSSAAIMIVLVVPMLLREYPLGSLFSLVGQLIIPAMILISVLLVSKNITIGSQIEKAYDNFMARVETNRQSGEESRRLTGDLWTIQNAYFKYPVFGIGLGSTYQGATILFGTSRYVYEFGYVESELVRVLLEGGWVVVILKLILGLLMAYELSYGGFMRWAVWFVAAFGQPIVFNPHNAAFLLMGIMLTDNIIWRQKQEALRKKAEAEAAVQEGYDALPVLTPAGEQT